MKICKQCLKEFEDKKHKNRIFCSLQCVGIYKRGKKYIKHIENPTSFKKGHISWNSGIPSNFKKENPGYDAVHEWIERWYGKTNKCDKCGTLESKRFEWSNISREYKRDIKDWQRLCTKCHQRYDYEKFGARKEFYL